MVINKIFDGIEAILKSLYPDYEIYMDEMEQSPEAPAFFIALLSSSQEQKLGDRLWQEHGFDIRYFPEDQKKPTREINDVLDQLRLALRYISIKKSETEDRLIQGTNIHHEVVNGVLHFLINFNVFVQLPREELPLMETLEQKDELKYKMEGDK